MQIQFNTIDGLIKTIFCSLVFNYQMGLIMRWQDIISMVCKKVYGLSLFVRSKAALTLKIYLSKIHLQIMQITVSIYSKKCPFSGNFMSGITLNDSVHLTISCSNSVQKKCSVTVQKLFMNLLGTVQELQ